VALGTQILVLKGKNQPLIPGIVFWVHDLLRIRVMKEIYPRKYSE
jgi:hypothetical protein